ncbi:MAG: methyltransferase domain-containing protein [Sedimentisphaerales bacterium]|nr:methyltransferase domain-containing protein [Sedimentisphaerales bacterium]
MDVLSDNQRPNFFDNMAVNVPKLYKEFPIVKEADSFCNKVPFTRDFLHRIYRCPIIPAKYRSLALKGFRQIRLDQGWFLEFRKYWSEILKGRPLWGLDDLYFLKNIYRMKFQNSEVADSSDSTSHCQAWQRPEVLYQLLHLVCRETVIDQLKILRILAGLKPDFKKLKMLEFGCATAPIAVSLYEFFKPKLQFKIYISDIPTLAFHYAAYRFRYCSNVVPILLKPEDDFALKLNDKLDVIFCITVFEHLNQPLEIAKTFHELLQPGGLLFFDYIKGSGEGLDTLQAVKQRDLVIDFIRDKFELVQGQLAKDKDMHLTIVQKK